MKHNLILKILTSVAEFGSHFSGSAPASEKRNKRLTWFNCFQIPAAKFFFLKKNEFNLAWKSIYPVRILVRAAAIALKLPPVLKTKDSGDSLDNTANMRASLLRNCFSCVCHHANLYLSVLCVGLVLVKL